MHAIIFKCFWHLNPIAVWTWYHVAVHQFALWWCLVCTSVSCGAQGETIRSPLKLIDGGDHRKSWGTSVFDCCTVICALLLCCQPFHVAPICAWYKTEQMGVAHLLAKRSALTKLNKLTYMVPQFIWSWSCWKHTESEPLQLFYKCLFYTACSMRECCAEIQSCRFM